MDGEDGGVADSLMAPVGEPWEGGDVEGTAKLTATPSSGSPGQKRVARSSVEDLNTELCVCVFRTSVLTCWRLP